MKKNKRSLWAAVLAATLLLTACGGTAVEPDTKIETASPGTETVSPGTETVSPGTETASADTTAAFPGTPGNEMVTLNVTSEPTEMNPLRLSDTIAQSVLYHCMSGLTRLDANDNPVADLAESWDISEDKTVYTMHLRRDAKWSNNDPVTAQDFYDSWVMQMTPATGTPYAFFLYQNIQNGEAFYNGEVDASELGLKVVDEHTLEITWSHPMASGLFFLSQPFFLPINKRAYEEIGDQAYAKEAGQMITNGAYRVTEWVHDSHIMLEKDVNYYDADNIHIPKVKLAMIGDMNTNLNAFMAGELDMCSLFSEQIAQVEAMSPASSKAYIDGGSWFLNFNTKAPYLSNLNLRKALAYSIDVQSLLDYVINDGSVAADGLVPTSITGADGESYAKSRGSLFAYDKAAAQDYLSKALKELSLTAAELKLTFYGTDTTYNQNQAAYLQQQWKENLGLDVALKAMPAKALSDAQRSGEYSFCVGGWGPSVNDPITFLENLDSESPSNYGGYANPAYDALVRDSNQEPDALKRQEMLMEAERILMDDMVVGPLYFTCTAYGQSDKLEGLVRTPFQFFNVRDAQIKE